MAQANLSYFSKVSNPGTSGGNSVWFYFDYDGDNVASLTAGTVNCNYFKRAYTVNGIVARVGDIVMVSSRTNATGDSNTASPCLFMVPATWDTNGASVVRPKNYY